MAVEPGAVSPIEELNGIAGGRASFDLITLAGRNELMHRDFTRMGHRNHPVLLGHNCGRVVNVDDPAEAWKSAKGRNSHPVPTPVRGAASASPPF